MISCLSTCESEIKQAFEEGYPDQDFIKWNKSLPPETIHYYLNATKDPGAVDVQHLFNKIWDL